MLPAATNLLDEYTGTYVLPGANSKWTEFNMETGDYNLTAEGRQKKESEQQEKGTEQLRSQTATIASLREQVLSLKHFEGGPERRAALDRQTAETDEEYIARLQADLADLQTAGSKQAATVTEYDWEAEAVASAAEQARRDAWAQKMMAQGREELQREDDDALIAKSQRDYDDARQKADKQSQIDAWRAQGAALGLLPVQDPDVPDPYVNSHGSDTVEHTHAISVPESIEHEEQNFVPISAAFRIRLDALEGPSDFQQVPAADVKAI